MVNKGLYNKHEWMDSILQNSKHITEFQTVWLSGEILNLYRFTQQLTILLFLIVIIIVKTKSF